MPKTRARCTFHLHFRWLGRFRGDDLVVDVMVIRLSRVFLEVSLNLVKESSRPIGAFIFLFFFLSRPTCICVYTGTVILY